MRKLLVVLTGVFFLFSACSSDKKQNMELQVSSPGKQSSVEFLLTENGRPTYTVRYNDNVIVDTSLLGFKLSKGNLEKNFEVANSSMRTTDNKWEQPWGAQRLIRNHYNELKIELVNKDAKQKINVIFRAFDDGVAFRYEFPEQEGVEELKIMDERTEFQMTGNHKSWWIPAYEGNRYEYIYEESPINELDKVHTPLTMETKEGIYVSIHEAALKDYSSMVIQSDGANNLKCDLVPWKNGVKTYAKVPSATPWRTIRIAEKPGDLITNYMMLNLNKPNKLDDVSWVKPGKYVGIWWEMHINTGTWHQGEKHAANTKNTKKYIDFAAKHGFDGILVEGWNVGWDGDWIKEGDAFEFTTTYPDYDIEEISKYAKDKGVYIVGHHETGAAVENYDNQLEEAYQFLEDHGMKAVKTGYVEHGDTLANGQYHHGQYFVRHYEKVLETAAKHKVMVVAHEPIKATGRRRTYPNMISREGARGQEYNAWAEDGGNPPSHTTILPFTRMLGGPMDFTPGVFDIKLPTQPDNQINTTLAKQLALYVVIYAPMQMACDLPENYEGHPAFQFIKDVAVDWETTKVLDAAIGEHVTIARKERKRDNWYLGSITNEEPRTIEVKLDFLDPERTYKATIYADGEKAHYMENPTDYVIHEEEVTSESVISLDLAASGGAAISFIPQ